MANISLTRVNQKLTQARVLLESLNAEPLPQMHENALKEAISFHLVCAHRHYLRELAETYGIKHAGSIQNESDLIEALISAKKHPAEAEELQVLRHAKQSWLARLLRYYESLWQPPIVNLPVSDDHAVVANDLINLVNLDASAAIDVIDHSTLAQWHQEFVVLVRRQRETSAEF